MHAELPEHSLIGRAVAQLETPALLVDLDAMEQNLQTMAEFFRKQSAKLRPHFKNHRVIDLTLRQIDNGAIGITCARLWQAEKLVSAGIKNVLIANELAGESPLRRNSRSTRENEMNAVGSSYFFTRRSKSSSRPNSIRCAARR